MTLEIGSVVEGVVTGIAPYGAFVRLPKGSTGLIHISEVADAYVKDVRQYLNEKDKIVVKVLGVNNKGKYDLSLKQVEGDKKALVVSEEDPGDDISSMENIDIDAYEKEKPDREKFEHDKFENEKYDRDKYDRDKYDRDKYDKDKPDRDKARSYDRDKPHFGAKKSTSYGNKGLSFEDKLSRFLKESEERILDLKRNTEAKRGKGRGR